MLAIFDLDETLIAGDSSHLFAHYLVDQGVVRDPDFLQANARFMADYAAGCLNLADYMTHNLAPLQGWSEEAVAALTGRFVSDIIAPRVLPGARTLIDAHRQAGHGLLIISATGEHLVLPIARHLGIPDALGVEVLWEDGHLSGAIGTRTPFREGKIRALQHWLEQPESDRKAWREWTFYSDSRNDLPLLQHVHRPVAVNPDATLQAHAQAQGWPVLAFALPG